MRAGIQKCRNLPKLNAVWWTVKLRRGICIALCRFIAAYNDAKSHSPDLSEDELFTSAADNLRSSGVILRSLSDIQKVCFKKMSF